MGKIALWTLAVLLLGVSPAVADDNKPPLRTSVGIGLGMFAEDSALEASQNVEPADQSFEFSSANLFVGQVWILFPVERRLRLGAGLRYAGNYIADRGSENEQEIEDYQFGHMLDLYMQFEFLVDTLPTVDLVLGLVGGANLLFPGGNFGDELQTTTDTVGGWGGPRPGFFLGPLLGVRWPIHPAFALRADMTITAGKILLFATDARAAGFQYHKDWSINAIRYQFVIGAEVNL